MKKAILILSCLLTLFIVNPIDAKSTEIVPHFECWAEWEYDPWTNSFKEVTVCAWVY